MSEARDPRTWYILGGIVLTGAVVGGIVYAVTRRQEAAVATDTPPTGPMVPPPPGPGEPGGPPLPGPQDGEPPETGTHGGVEDLSPAQQAQLAYDQNKLRIERSILRQLDRAAAQKGVDGGWVEQAQGGPMVLQGVALNPSPAKGPDVWSQPEAWWVATETVKELGGGEDELADLQVWAAALQPLGGSGGMGPDAPQAYLKGKIMRRVMDLTGANTQQVGALTPDWTIF